MVVRYSRGSAHGHVLGPYRGVCESIARIGAGCLRIVRFRLVYRVGEVFLWMGAGHRPMDSRLRGNDGGGCGNDVESNLLRPGRNPCRKSKR